MSKDKSLRGKIEFAELSDNGMVREHNEDRIGVWQAPHPSPWGPLAVVADGLGGHAAGEVASQAFRIRGLHHFLPRIPVSWSMLP